MEDIKDVKLSLQDLEKLAQSRIEIEQNLDYLENKALTCSQQKTINKLKRSFFKENKLSKANALNG